MRNSSLLAAALAAALLLSPVARAEHPAPTDAQIKKALENALGRGRKVSEGKNADYIPELAKVPAKLFGIALVTVDGKVFAVGDSDALFSIQSISKVFTMALVMQEKGEQAIADGVGVDATGQVFNSIVAIEQYRGHQMNPLVNPGAIATTGMVSGTTDGDKWTKILATHNEFAGRSLTVNEPVYESEAATNQRNRAIAALMSAYGLIEDDPIMVTDVYTRQCSINVSAKDLAAMAATLANGGQNPVTRKQVLAGEHVPQVLAVMATAGLYDDSGIWLYKVGLPAKSGVGGGIIAVAPGKFGIAAFAPPLDAAGNSVRAQVAIEAVVNELGANLFASTPHAPAAK
ncbi:MAG TPA: glutaminase A [Planctomycetota bacterium]|nr:glutaminase A [Planctomycetota bacterium]